MLIFSPQVTALVLRVNKEKKTLSLSLKPSHFSENDVIVNALPKEEEEEEESESSEDDSEAEKRKEKLRKNREEREKRLREQRKGEDSDSESEPEGDGEESGEGDSDDESGEDGAGIFDSDSDSEEYGELVIGKANDSDESSEEDSDVEMLPTIKAKSSKMSSKIDWGEADKSSGSSSSEDEVMEEVYDKSVCTLFPAIFIPVFLSFGAHFSGFDFSPKILLTLDFRPKNLSLNKKTQREKKSKKLRRIK